MLGIVLARFHAVNGWRFRDVALLYGLVQAAAGVARVLIWPLDHFGNIYTQVPVLETGSVVVGSVPLKAAA